jgi:hypothetical protein
MPAPNPRIPGRPGRVRSGAVDDRVGVTDVVCEAHAFDATV